MKEEEEMVGTNTKDVRRRDLSRVVGWAGASGLSYGDDGSNRVIGSKVGREGGKGGRVKEGLHPRAVVGRRRRRALCLGR